MTTSSAIEPISFPRRSCSGLRRPPAGGLAAVGRSLRPGRLSLVPAAWSKSGGCGQRGPGRVHRPWPPTSPASTETGPGDSFLALGLPDDHATPGLRPFSSPARPAWGGRGERWAGGSTVAQSGRDREESSTAGGTVEKEPLLHPPRARNSSGGIRGADLGRPFGWIVVDGQLTGRSWPPHWT